MGDFLSTARASSPVGVLTRRRFVWYLLDRILTRAAGFASQRAEAKEAASHTPISQLFRGSGI